MSDNYDSILKEKKVYTDPVIENKHPLFKRAIKIGIFIAVVIIIISYIIYFNTILSSESIFLNNMVKIFDKYSLIYDNLNLNYDISNNYIFDGDILIDDKKYDYSFIKDNDKIKRSLINGDKNITYYRDNNLNYVNIHSFGDTYVKLGNKLFNFDYYRDSLDFLFNDINGYVNKLFLNSDINNITDRFYNIDNYGGIIENIKSNYNGISSQKYIKKFYLEEKKPIVEIDLVLNKSDINNILDNSDLYVDDDVDMSIIMKNHAVTNEICNIKVIVNNGTKNIRTVINYSDDGFVITNDQGKNYKIVYKANGRDVTIKFYKDELLYSVLVGKGNDNEYEYIYQVIDKIYNIKFISLKSNNTYNYVFESNVDNKISKLEIVGNYSSDGVIDSFVSNSLNYEELNPDVKKIFNKTINELLFGN